MKTYLLLVFMACQSVAALAQETTQAPYETKSLADNAIKDVYVETSGGSILVSGATGQTPRIEVYVHSSNDKDLSKDEIKKLLDKDYELEVSVSGHEVHALAKRKHDGDWGWKNQLSISFKIYVPLQVNTHLETSGGSIHLDNLDGKENFSTSGGSLHLEALAGVIKGETSGGSIDVSNSGDDINLETSGGTIKATDCHGNIKLETSGGSLRLTNLKGTINANTSGGSIHADHVEGELITGTSGGSVDLTQMYCSLEASTSGGSMNVEMAQTGKYVKLDVSGGHVNLKLPAKQGYDLNLSAEKINPSSYVSNFTGEWNKEHVSGSLNGGGIPVKVDASGHLDLSFD